MFCMLCIVGRTLLNGSIPVFVCIWDRMLSSCSQTHPNDQHPGTPDHCAWLTDPRIRSWLRVGIISFTLASLNGP